MLAKSLFQNDLEKGNSATPAIKVLHSFSQLAERHRAQRPDGYSHDLHLEHYDNGNVAISSVVHSELGDAHIHSVTMGNGTAAHHEWSTKGGSLNHKIEHHPFTHRLSEHLDSIYAKKG